MPAEPKEDSLFLNFFVSWREYAAAERELNRVTRLSPNSLIAAVVFLIAGVVCYALSTPWWLTTLAFTGSILNLCVPFFRALGIRMRWNREQLLRCEHRVWFSDDGLKYELGGIESELCWSYFQRWLETSQGFLLIYGGDVFSLIPKSAVTKVCPPETFRNFLASHLPRLSMQTSPEYSHSS